LAAAWPCDARAGGSDCQTGASVRVCVEWTAGSNPIHGTHYHVDFSDASNPDLVLDTAENWTVYAELVSNGNLANLGDVTTPDSNDYSVKISRSGGAGAATIGSIVLTPGGDHYAQILSGSSMTGNLTGDLIVQADSSDNGGTANGFYIGGNVTGNVTLRDGAGLTIGSAFAAPVPRRHATRPPSASR